MTKIIARCNSITYIDHPPGFLIGNPSFNTNCTFQFVLIMTQTLSNEWLPRYYTGTQSPICFSQRSTCVSLQFSSYSSIVCTCSNMRRKTAFLCSVHFVNLSISCFNNNAKKYKLLNVKYTELPPLALDRLSF